MNRTIRLWVEDKPGVLMRVAGVVTAKGANIHTLTVAPDPNRQGIAHITLVAEVEPRLTQRVVNEMNRLVQVLEAIDISGETEQPAHFTFSRGSGSL